MKRLPVSRTLELSTGHLPATEAGDSIEAYASMTCEYGWLFSTARDVPVTRFPTLVSALVFARRKRFAYVRFDSDGPLIDALPTFDW